MFEYKFKKINMAISLYDFLNYFKRSSIGVLFPQEKTKHL